MTSATKYMHQLEQLGGELRTAADGMEKFKARLTILAMLNRRKEELQAMYHEYLELSGVEEVIDRLYNLVKSMKDNEELEPEHTLEPDLISANQHALRLCAAMLEISKRLTTVRH